MLAVANAAEVSDFGMYIQEMGTMSQTGSCLGMQLTVRFARPADGGRCFRVAVTIKPLI